jgi:vacuolar-type H+-ATPase subunit F/Vma7
MKKIFAVVTAAIVMGVTLAGCTSAADQANENLSKAAENFEVPRRIVGINAITDKVLFSVEGFCSIENDGKKLDVTCKVPDGAVERTTLGLSDNVTYVSTQMGGKKVNLFRPRIIFRPETIIPNFELSTS